MCKFVDFGVNDLKKVVRIFYGKGNKFFPKIAQKMLKFKTFSENWTFFDRVWVMEPYKERDANHG